MHSNQTGSKSALPALAMIFGIAMCAMAGPSHAEIDWGSPGGWDLVEGDDMCALTTEYEGEGDTRLSLWIDLEGYNMLSVDNWKWSADKGTQYDLRYILDDIEYSGGISIGTVSDSIRKGFVTRFPDKFLDQFAKASSFRIYKGDVLVDQLSLKGSGVAVPQLRKCLAHVSRLRAAEAQKKARFAHIPVDPFAEEPVTDASRKTAESPGTDKN